MNILEGALDGNRRSSFGTLDDTTCKQRSALTVPFAILIHAQMLP